MTALSLALSLTLAYAGMLLLCLGMERHWKQLASPHLPLGLRRLCAPLGWALLGLAVYGCSLIWPPGMAWVAGLGLISLAGLALLLILPYAPRAALGLPVLGAAACAVLAL